jgi:hypothetical protein
MPSSDAPTLFARTLRRRIAHPGTAIADPAPTTGQLGPGMADPATSGWPI